MQTLNKIGNFNRLCIVCVIRQLTQTASEERRVLEKEEDKVIVPGAKPKRKGKVSTDSNELHTPTKMSPANSIDQGKAKSWFSCCCCQFFGGKKPNRHYTSTPLTEDILTS